MEKGKIGFSCLVVLVLLSSFLFGTASAETDPANQGAYTVTSVDDGVRSTLRITLEPETDGSLPELTAAEQEQIDALLAESSVGAAPLAEGGGAAPQAQTLAGKKKGPFLMKCDKNSKWSDGNGTLNARFNCRSNVINWGYEISTKVRGIITGQVNERGVSWWKNGTRIPKGAPHLVGKNCHFHGTLKPVKSGDVVQFQDYMTFRVRVGGKTGTGSITWASNVKAGK
ncbi:hypothetical protein [Nocardiopsis ansamitocini]|uniref:Secreted protein n=1 Tax=Nocardiopsis ansamitocini TaxID=1670832 RepID=A0A9W6P5L9_9ACTN|nr:hypothetical protein [Nocardiopsis ansamitocini]GLU47849.1 hypothetical protein Nans01_22000 [Nocardiopsis ansamitocini]